VIEGLWWAPGIHPGSITTVLLKHKGQQGYKECPVLDPAVQMWSRVLVSERWPVDTGHQPVASGGGQFSTSLGVVWEPGMPRPTYSTNVWSVPCSSDWFHMVLSELKVSLPSCQSEPAAEERVIKSARRICCFLALRSRSLEVKVESQKLRNLPGSNVSVSVDKFERTSISTASNIVS